MKCDNFFCIYWADGRCILSEIELDIQGNCSSCIYVKIPEDILEKKRREAIEKL